MSLDGCRRDSLTGLGLSILMEWVELASEGNWCKYLIHTASCAPDLFILVQTGQICQTREGENPSAWQVNNSFLQEAPERSRNLTLFKTREKYQLSLILSTSFLCPQKSHHIDLQIDENFIGSSVTVDTQGFCYPDNWKVRATRPVYDWSSSPSSFLT